MSDFTSSYIGKVQKLHACNHINCKIRREAKVVKSWKKVKIAKKPKKTKQHYHQNQQINQNNKKPPP